MCGTLGSINLDFDHLLLDQIKHRGPDDSGMESFLVNDHKIVLGQRRLAILDLSPAGHQPMISSCGDYALIFNGEIYNHQELREKLTGQYTFKGHSDTESILYYLIENGIQGVRDFNGIFAFALLDRKQSKMYLARDPFGVKPLYYHLNEDQLIFSSEIRPIKSKIENKEQDLDALASLLRLRFNPSPETLYKDIRKVRPCHYMEVDLNSKAISVERKTYYIPAPLKIGNLTKEKEIELYGEYFEEAVNRQLLSDVPVGILLSGGVDSAMVAAVAQKHSEVPLKAFTIGFEGDHNEDEILDAAKTAEYLGLEHHSKKITFGDFLSIIKKCSEIVEEPLGTTSMIPMYYLSQLASKHVKVVVTGQGADEPLGGYPRYKSELFLNSIPGPLQKFAKKIIPTSLTKNEKVSRGLKALGITDDVTRFLATYELFTNNEIAELINHRDSISINRLRYYHEILATENKIHTVEKMMAVDSRMNLADDLLNYTDKITMNFALECRVPILDLKLIRFIESVPYHSKLNLKKGKIIHREFAKRLLPDEIINRKKKGFASPTSHWFKSEVNSFKEILLKGDTAFGKIFNQRKVAEVIAQHENGYPREKQIFLLLSIYYFFENFEEN